MRSWRDGDPLVGNNNDWSGLARSKQRPRYTLWVRRKKRMGDAAEWKQWLQAAQRASKLDVGFPEIHLVKAGSKRILIGDLPAGEWIPLFRIRRKRGALSLAATLNITHAVSQLLAQSEALGITSDKPLQRELLFDQQDSSLLLCGHWRVTSKNDQDHEAGRLTKLIENLCGQGKSLDDLLGRIATKRASGRIYDARSMERELKIEIEAIAGDIPLGTDEWFAKRRRAPMKLMSGFAIMLALGAGVFTGWQLINQHGRPVPNMVGASAQQALQTIDKGGWKAKTRFQVSRILPGRVISQKPKVHQLLAGGGTITLVVSKPSKTARVPKLVGMDMNDARDTLWGLGLNWKPLSTPRGKVGVVVKTVPAAGAVLPGGFAVTVYYGAP